MSEMTPAAKIAELMRAMRPLEIDVELIRVGSRNDGGYLVPNDFSDIKAIFSPGVDNVSSFEAFFAELGLPCYLADASVEAPPITHALFDFEKKYIGPESAGDWISLEDWIHSKHPQAGDLLLQMDIEGHEWDVIPAVPMEVLSRFRIVVIELHNFHEMACNEGFTKISGALTRLLELFVPVHIHANNNEFPVLIGGIQVPPVLEVTFLRKDRIRTTRNRDTLRHPLDSKCSLIFDEIDLDDAWPG